VSLALQLQCLGGHQSLLTTDAHRFAHHAHTWSINHEVAARNLAADRVTSLLPVLTAVVGFFVSIALSYGKTATQEWKVRDPAHVSMHAIAFSMTLAGCVPAVMLAATVGVPQTRLSVRRILCQLKDAQGGRVEARDSTDHFHALHEYDVRKCLHNGAVPSWRFDRWSWTTSSPSVPRQAAVHRPFWRELGAVAIVLIGSAGAIGLSASVPPTGCITCRISCELVIMFTYLTSYLLGIVFSKVSKERDGLHFWLILTKDVCAALILTTLIVLIVVGGLNRLGCWSACDGIYPCLPEMTREVVQARLKTFYPAIIFVTFTLLVASWMIIARLLWDGISVYLQRDDEEVWQVRISPGVSQAFRSAANGGSSLILSAWNVVPRPPRLTLNGWTQRWKSRVPKKAHEG